MCKIFSAVVTAKDLYFDYRIDSHEHLIALNPELSKMDKKQYGRDLVRVEFTPPDKDMKIGKDRLPTFDDWNLSIDEPGNSDTPDWFDNDWIRFTLEQRLRAAPSITTDTTIGCEQYVFIAAMTKVLIERTSAAMILPSGTVTENYGTVTENYGTVAHNFGTVTYNFGTVAYNSGTVTENYGTVTKNYSDGTVAYNYGTVTENFGIVAKNSGTVADNYSGGTVAYNYSGGTVTKNYDTVAYNSGTVAHNYSDGTVARNSGTVTNNSGTVTENYGTVTHDDNSVEV